MRVLRHALKLTCNTRTASGDFLLAVNPARGLEMPRNPDPKRERYTHDEFVKMLEVAERVRSYMPALLIVAHGTGRRIGAICRLRWTDFDAEKGTITWPADSDKLRRTWEDIPVSSDVKDALEAHRKIVAGIGQTFIFPAPMAPDRPLGRPTAYSWLRKAEELAGVERRKHRGWHALRRTFATEMKHTPTRDLMTLGGWTTAESLRRCYESADTDTMLEALSQRRRLREAK